MNIFGQVNKPGKARRDTPSDQPRGRELAQARQAQLHVQHGPEPVGAAFMQAVFNAVLPSSPMSRGRDVHHNTGAGIVGRFAGRTGPVQNWKALAQPVATPRRRSLGAESGPSQQAGIPGTGSASQPSGIHNALLMSSQMNRTAW